MNDTSVWDRDYRQRGRLYGGVVRLPFLPPGTRVLEVGCGDGRTLPVLAERSCHAVGLDLSPAALALCRARMRGAQPFLVRGDARRLPFRDGSFDAVLLLHVLGHERVAGRQSMADEAVRVTAPGGRLHVRVFSREDFRAGAGDAVEDGTRRRSPGVLTHYFAEQELAALFPSCRPLRLETRRWQLRVRGALLPRAEIEALFESR